MSADKTPVIVSIQTPFYPIPSTYDKRTLTPMDNLPMLEAYADALRREIENAAEDYDDCLIEAIRVGGGIAGHAFDEQLGTLLRDMHEWYHLAPDCEITVEVHPGMVSVETLNACRRGKVTTLCIDYATSDPFESEAMGRFLPPSAMDTTQMVLANAPLKRTFNLMLGLPGQSIGSLHQTLEKVVSYGATEIVLHSLRLIPGTPFADQQAAAYAASTSPRKHLPNEKERTALWQSADKWLYVHDYEMIIPGRYARKGCTSLFHQLQVENCAMLGFGAGAHTRLDGVEAVNTSNLDTYIRHSPDPARIVEKAWPIPTIPYGAE